MRPIIGITTNNMKNPTSGADISTGGWNYNNAVLKGGGLPMLLPCVTDGGLLDQMVAACDGFVFCGGIDVTPCSYGEMAHPLLGDTSLKLDRCQIPLMQKIIAARKPVLAICRGNQVLNVACGGTLYQDNSLKGEGIARHMIKDDMGDISHQVTITPGTKLHQLFGDRIWTNSYHHQSVKKLGDGLVISAMADDGIVEAIELKDYPYGLGIQWHPEGMLVAGDNMLPLFQGLADACRKG
ncbi:MAG TPA: gamma-glutamyl-gamma-aminobutyrate hydrolase family protein [Candidatus Ventrimonas merdavium]|nr:gamma-glutamyl-gamma-aminobutyrate hydrolase family protein [Candidatus Ventrimonas merdavium]